MSAIDARERFLEAVVTKLRAQWLSSDCQSPIEARMFWALCQEIFERSISLRLPTFQGTITLDLVAGELRAGQYPLPSRTLLGNADWQSVLVVPQVHIGDYRADYVLEYRVGDPQQNARTVMVVECDGHDYHERTKQQARHDKRRDRYMTASGLRVLRFTGSEIFADANKCASESLQVLIGILPIKAWADAEDDELAEYKAGDW
jgi:very-short-patch-repair endonuclease